MLTGNGIVVKTDGKSAVVRIRKSSACGHDCGECRVCNNPEFETEVINQIGAKVGDKVLIGAPTGQILLSAFLVYMLPVLGVLIVGIVLSSFFESAFVIASGCVVWVLIWFFIIRRRNSKNASEKGTILEVINEEN